jgi:5-epimerase
VRARELAVAGAFEFTATTGGDAGVLAALTLSEEEFARAVGRPVFSLTQASYSRSRRGVVRGLHYSVVPPGRPKYVCCPRGSALDIIVDIRVGSPTFGRHEAVVFEPGTPRGIYFPSGVGHVFVALRDDTVMSYLLRGAYVPKDERALSVFDPALALPLPPDLDLVVSDRDRVAPTLAEAADAGLLPTYAACLAVDQAPLAATHSREVTR